MHETTLGDVAEALIYDLASGNPHRIILALAGIYLIYLILRLLIKLIVYDYHVFFPKD